VIRGEKVVLRPKQVKDAVTDYSWRIDAELARLDAAVPLTLPFRDFLFFYEEELAFEEPRRCRWAIETFDGRHIGNCMCYDIDYYHGQAEVGIMIGDRRFWSQGYGTDAINSMVDHLFNTTALQRLYLHTLDWNVRAQKCFQKTGFMPQGKVLRGGQTFVLMAMERSQWEARHRNGVDSTPEAIPTRGNGM